MKRVDDRKQKSKLTPMQKQWVEISKQYPEYILFFRLGDFYETFREQAVEVSKALNITLTSRKTAESEWELAGVPHHALENYLAKMVEKGYKVAIVEQLEDPSKAKKIVKRGVVRLVTKGTLTEPESLPKLNNYLVSVNKQDRTIGLAAIDLSTGEFVVTDFEDIKQLEVELARLNPAEILVEKTYWEKLELELDLPKCTITYKSDYYFDVDQAKKDLCEHFNVLSLNGFGIEDTLGSTGAAGAILRYLKETQLRESFPNIVKISPLKSQDFMALDASTIRSLELVESLQDKTSFGTLLEVLDNTKTSTGSRLLTYWLLRPSVNKKTIEDRLEATNELFSDVIVREEIREILKKMSDIERIITRIGLGRAKPRELIALKDSIMLIPDIVSVLSKFKTALMKEITKNLNPLEKLVEILQTGISDEVPANLADGGVIRENFNQELDELRKIKKSGKDFLTSLEAREKQKTGIKTLKVRFNKVFGYYIEVSKTYSDKVPAEYERKQTLVNSERYITPELKEYEEKILTAEDKILVLEEELYKKILVEITQFTARVQQNAHYCAILDIVSTFAENASYYNYVKPEIVENTILEIEQGRHPVVERILPSSSFIPNDCLMEEDKNRIWTITGPNMSGKSTYLRQVALITLMAHIGSFVPAASAKIGLTDRIFTRIGAHDVLVENRSTFMVEMYEAANILNNTTERSLVILDELGRGTSTFDGVSLAWSISEYLHNNVGRKGPRTLLATHYHELIELEEMLPRVKNYHVSVKNVNGDIHFLYKIKEGGIDESYGVHVASLAGLPERVIDRANEILSQLHHQMGQEQPRESKTGKGPSRVKAGKYRQVTLLGETTLQATSTKDSKKEHQKAQQESIKEIKLLKEVANLDVDKITPIEAINVLDQLIRKSKRILREK